MCATCGCSDGAKSTVTHEDGSHSHLLGDGRVITHAHHHDTDDVHHERREHQHHHEQSAPKEHPALIDLEVAVLAKNDRLAERNRGWFLGRDVVALNLMSSPGSGKTTLLERTLRELDSKVSVLEGDQETERDAERIRATGAPAVQINTGTGCHLEADMVWEGVQSLSPPMGSVLFIENVGNLVCPALFDLGEDARVVLFSVTEGEDKPLKYPHMFRVADLVLITKTDLSPHVDFSLPQARAAIEEVRPGVPVLELSAKSGVGLDAWYRWVLGRRTARASS